MNDRHPGSHTAEEWCAICDSYAAENQRFSDELDRLRAECWRWEQKHHNQQDELDRLRSEVARLRMALEYVSDHDPDKPSLHGELIDILRSAVAGAKAALTTNSSLVE